MTTTTAQKFATGTRVHVAPEYVSSFPGRANVAGSTYTVTGKGPKNYTLKPVDGPAVGSPGLRAPEHMLAEGGYPAGSGGTIHGGMIIPFVSETLHDTGSVVQFKPGHHPTGHHHDGLWVVTGYGKTGHQLFPLGGSTRYLKSIHGDRLVTVTPKVKKLASGTVVQFALATV